MEKIPAIVGALLVFGAGLVAGVRVAPDEIGILETASRGGAPPGPDAAFVALASPVRFEDPVGDATDTGTGDTKSQLGCFVGHVVTAHECMDLPAPTPSVGTDGAHYDITGVTFEGETATEIVVSLEIARLTEGFPELVMPDGIHRMSNYGVCWAIDDDDYCSRWAYAMVMAHEDGAMVHAVFDAYVDACNEWWWCSWTVPFEITYGSPGKMTWRVPKAYAGIDGRPLAASEFQAYTGWVEEATAFAMWHPGVTVHTPFRHVHDHTGFPALFSSTDMTGHLYTDLTFAPLAAGPPALAADRPLLDGAVGSHVPGSPYDRPELDLVGFDLYEDARALVVAIAVREWKQQPDYEFDIEAAIGIEGSEVWELGVRQEMGELTGYAGECIMQECQDGVLVEVPVEVIPGAPGVIQIRVPLEMLDEGGTAKRERTTMVSVASMFDGGSHYWGSYDEDYFGDVHSVFMVDGIWGGAPYVFGSGHRGVFQPIAEGHGH
ncbi:MAG: hypothetical protein ACT4PT_10125 [Methanobacteriota archaeon]